nr:MULTISPECIES: hypothetical protein [unclassified Paenibacillus]
MKTKKTEDPSVMNWINAQTNLMDSLRYLIEHEILHNGVRNLQTFIPVERNVLGSVPPLQEGPMNTPQSNELLPNATVVLVDGMREIREGREEASAGQSVQREEPERPNLSMPQKETRQPEVSTRPMTELNADDEIDDEDIESWV